MGVLQEEGNDQCLSQLILLIWSNLLSCLSNWCFMIQRLWSRASLVAQTVKNLPAMWETCVQCLGWEDPLEEEMATHSSILAWRIPWTENLEGYSPWDRKLSDTAETKHTAQLWSMRLPSASTLLVIQFPHPETPPTNCFLLSHQPLPAPFTLQSTVRHIIKSSLQDKIIQPLFSTVYALWPYHNYVIYHSKLHLCVYLLSLLVIVTSG